ncbi:hemagglutinin repeat-containing protein, partial [Veillonella magna]
GASIGTTGFLGGDIGINKAKSEGLTDRTTHTGTTVVGTEAVSITSGQDTNVVGSTVSGNKVVAKVGDNLTITSVQDTDNYKSTSKTSGMSISYTPGHAGIVSGGTTKGDIHSQYRSVT